jgi:DNA-binding XRE family transcriptional regulator
METITIEGKEGCIKFIPASISFARLSKIQRELAKLVKAQAPLIAHEIRAILKKKDTLIGTSGGTIKAYRFREGLTQQDLAQKSGIKQSHISEMEKNKRPVGLKVAKKLADALNCHYHRFF